MFRPILAALAVSLSLPAGAETAAPRALSVEQAPLAAVAPAAGVRAINVSAALDRAGAVYAIGEPVGLTISVSHTSYVTIFNVAPDGSTTVLFPNRFQRDALVEAGEVVPVPGASARIVARAPAGLDLVKVVASTRPLDLTDLGRFNLTGVFAKAGAGSANVIARKLAIAAEQTAAPGAGARPPVLPSSGAWGETSLTLLTTPGPVRAPAVLLEPVAEPFTLALGVEKLAYRVGEPVRFIVEASRDCELSMIAFGPGGRTRILVPSVEPARLPARTAMRIHGGAAGLVAAAPTGIETVRAFCAAAEHTAAAEAPRLASAEPRDLLAVAPSALPQAAIAEAEISFRITE